MAQPMPASQIPWKDNGLVWADGQPCTHTLATPVEFGFGPRAQAARANLLDFPTMQPIFFSFWTVLRTLYLLFSLLLFFLSSSFRRFALLFTFSIFAQNLCFHAALLFICCDSHTAQVETKAQRTICDTTILSLWSQYCRFAARTASHTTHTHAHGHNAQKATPNTKKKNRKRTNKKEEKKMSIKKKEILCAI